MNKKDLLNNRNSLKNKLVNSEKLAGYLFISPWLLGFLAFMIAPMIITLYYSFTSYNIVGSPVFIGWQNYVEIFDDPKFYTALKVTFTYVFFSVPLRLSFALVLAVIFNQAQKLTDFYRAVYYIPSILGGSVAVSVLWRQMFGYHGATNTILMSLGLLEQPVSWIHTPDTALWTLILMAVWQFGSPMIIFLAGLRQIPKSLYESASIDGANWGQKFFQIIIPLLTPVIFFNLIMQIIRLFMAFTRVYIITQGGPIDRTLVYVLYLFRKAFRHTELGYASALAWVLLIIMGVVTFIIFRSSKYWVFYQSEEGNN